MSVNQKPTTDVKIETEHLKNRGMNGQRTRAVIDDGGMLVKDGKERNRHIYSVMAE